MTTQLVNELHQELIKLHNQQDAISKKYDLNFGLHKTRLVSAQEDKDQWHRLQRNINTFDSMLCYYGYATSGPNHVLHKES